MFATAHYTHPEYESAGLMHDFESFFLTCQQTKLLPLREVVMACYIIHQKFRIFDRGDVGYMTPLDLGRGITDLFGWRPTRYESEKLLASVDHNEDGKIDYLEFAHMIHGVTTDGQIMAPNPALKKIREAMDELTVWFKLFDIDDDDAIPELLISKVEFSKLVRSMGMVYTDRYLEEVFASIDSDGGGTLDYVEFSDMITGADEATRVAKEMIQALTPLNPVPPPGPTATPTTPFGMDATLALPSPDA